MGNMRPNYSRTEHVQRGNICLLYGIHYGRIVLYSTSIVNNLDKRLCSSIPYYSAVCDFLLHMYVKLLWFCNKYSITIQNTNRTDQQLFKFERVPGKQPKTRSYCLKVVAPGHSILPMNQDLLWHNQELLLQYFREIL